MTSDHYLEQLRHQLDQTRADLRRAEDELAVHRQRASRETRLRLAWQSARRRANWQRAILADYRTEAVARAAELEYDEAWRSMWPFGPILPLWQPEHLGAAFGEGAKPWWAVRAEEDRQRDLVRERLDGQLPVTPEPMALPSEEQMRYRVRQELGVVKLPIPADMVDLVALVREQQDRAMTRGFWNTLIYGPQVAAAEPKHECRVWEDEGEWNVSCRICDAYVDNVGNETDAEEWAQDHLEFGNQACGCWHSGCGHATTEPQL